MFVVDVFKLNGKESRDFLMDFWNRLSHTKHKQVLDCCFGIKSVVVICICQYVSYVKYPQYFKDIFLCESKLQ